MAGRRGRREESTAAEFMAALSADPEFHSLNRKRDAEIEERGTRWREAEQPLVEALVEVAVPVASVWDLVSIADPYPAALPVLMKFLEQGGLPDRVMEGAARALAVQSAGAYWYKLRDVYLRAAGPDTRMGLAAALAATASVTNVDAMAELLRDESRGNSRGLLVEPIVNIGGSRGRAVVESLRQDPVIGPEARAVLSSRSRTT